MGNVKLPNSFRYSAKLLAEYSRAALENAEDLIDEAELLLRNGHFSRAYFIAVASIEEIGKSFIAFEAQGRNLNDSAVTSKIGNSLESHSKKIISAFRASVLTHGDLKNELMGIIDLMIALKNGREPSMYTDIDYVAAVVRSPKDVIRQRAATDCVYIAKHCYFKNIEYQRTTRPIERKASEDYFYGMKDKKVNELFNNGDFWWYHIANMEAGNHDLSETIVTYQRDYLKKGKKFRSETED
jgi:AbiV family abortive infection protein